MAHPTTVKPVTTQPNGLSILTNLRWLEWAVTRYFRNQGCEVRLRSIKVGNVVIEGEVIGKDWRMAVEIKTPNDDTVRGIGQLAESLAYGYNQAALVTTLRKARTIRRRVVERLRLIGIDSEGILHYCYPETVEPY